MPSLCSPAHPTQPCQFPPLRFATSSLCQKTPSWKTLALIQQLEECSLLFPGYFLRSIATASMSAPPSPYKPLLRKRSAGIVYPKVTGLPAHYQSRAPFLHSHLLETWLPHSQQPQVSLVPLSPQPLPSLYSFSTGPTCSPEALSEP